MKKALLILAFIFILVAIPLTVFLARQQQDIRQRAAPATTIAFQPSQITVAPGQEFDLDAVITSNENVVCAAELHITFSAQYLEALSITSADFMPNILESGVPQSGSASITVGAGTQCVQGTGSVARIHFRALADTEGSATAVNFAATSQVAAAGEGATDVLVSSSPAQVTIAAAGGASPSPSAVASPAVSPSPGSASPSPSATPLVSASPSPSATPGTGGGTASPTPTPPATGTTTTITSPPNGSTVTTPRPTISGASFANALMVLSINTSPQHTATFYANAQGAWTYTPTTDIVNGTYTITVTGSPASGNSEVVTSTMTVSVSGTGGTTSTTATPTPTPSPSAGTAPAASGTGGAIPVTGSVEQTLFLAAAALILLLFGAGALFL